MIENKTKKTTTKKGTVSGTMKLRNFAGIVQPAKFHNLRNSQPAKFRKVAKFSRSPPVAKFWPNCKNKHRKS